MPPVFGVLFDGFAYGMLLFLMSVGLSVTLGMMNFVNLAHCSFAMLGGYVAITLMNALGWPFLATLPAAFIAAAALSVVLERIFFRRFYNASDLDQCLLTIGIVFMSIATAAYIYGTDQQPMQLPPYLRGSIAFMGLDLAAGGHLTHGSPVNMSGKWFKASHYTVRREDQIIDMDAVAKQAEQVRPKLIIAGGSAYSRPWDFKRFREIADSVGAYLLVDMAHFAGLVAGGVHASPVPHAHVTTTTTHKSLRGPRGGLILARANEEITKKLNSMVFPGTQGGPLMHVIAAKAVALLEALQPQFRDYQRQVLANARAMAARLASRGYQIVSGGTDNHLFLMSLADRNITGKDADAALGQAYITVNKNAVPNDPRPPSISSGLRIGTPAVTTRGFKEAEVRQLTNWIADVLDTTGDESAVERVRGEVVKICRRFPVYG